jgi:hypothetical protein
VHQQSWTEATDEIGSKRDLTHLESTGRHFSIPVFIWEVCEPPRKIPFGKDYETLQMCEIPDP